MASLHRHCALTRSRLPSTASSSTSALRSRSIHAAVRLNADPSGGEDKVSKDTQKLSSRPQLRSVARNKAAVSAISSDQASSIQNTVKSFVGGGKLSRFPLRSIIDVPKPGSANGSPLKRRMPSANRDGDNDDSHSAAGPRRGGGGRGGQGGGARGRAARSIGGRGASGGAGRAPRHSRRKGLYDEPDDMDLADVAAEEGEDVESLTFEEDNDEDDMTRSELGLTVSGITEDMSNPSAVLAAVRDMKLNSAERAYVMDRVADHTRAVPYNPSFDPADLTGYGPRFPIGNTHLGAVDGLHQALSRAAHLYGGKPADRHTPDAAAHEWMFGRTVFLRNEAERKEFDEAALRYAEHGRQSRAKREGKELADVPLEHTELLSPKPEDRAAVNAVFIAGKYTAPGDLAPKNASDAVRNVYMHAARNRSYFEEDQKSLATKIAALLPAAKPVVAGKVPPQKKTAAKA